MRAIIDNAVEAASSDMSWKAIDRYSKDYVELQTKDKVRFYKTPDAMLQSQLEVYDAAAKKRKDNAIWVEIEESQKEVRRARGALVSRHPGEHAHGVQPLLRQARGGQEGVGYADAGSSHPARAGWLFSFRRRPIQPFDSVRPAHGRRSMQKILLFVDKVSTWVGQAFSFFIVLLTLHVSWEVFSRYALDNPRAWAFDVMIMLYGTLFMMAGAYTLSKNGHVRGDVLYGFFRPRTQASLDLMLYIVFFIPGVIALTYAGYFYAADSWRINENSNITYEGPPVYPFKTVIPLAGAFLLVQGIVEIIRCIICIKQGEWPSREEDVEEVDVEKLKEDGPRQGRGHREARSGGRAPGAAASEAAQGTLVRLLADGDHRDHHRWCSCPGATSPTATSGCSCSR